MPYAKMAVAVVHQINLMRLVYEGKKDGNNQSDIKDTTMVSDY